MKYEFDNVARIEPTWLKDIFIFQPKRSALILSRAYKHIFRKSKSSGSRVHHTKKRISDPTRHTHLNEIKIWVKSVRAGRIFLDLRPGRLWTRPKRIELKRQSHRYIDKFSSLVRNFQIQLTDDARRSIKTKQLTSYI